MWRHIDACLSSYLKGNATPQLDGVFIAVVRKLRNR
jgi:hypothetical protein